MHRFTQIREEKKKANLRPSAQSAVQNNSSQRKGKHLPDSVPPGILEAISSQSWTIPFTPIRKSENSLDHLPHRLGCQSSTFAKKMNHIIKYQPMASLGFFKSRKKKEYVFRFVTLSPSLLKFFAVTERMKRTGSTPKESTGLTDPVISSGDRTIRIKEGSL